MKTLDDCDNGLLVAEFSKKKVRSVVWSCDDNKSPGPNAKTSNSSSFSGISSRLIS